MHYLKKASENGTSRNLQTRPLERAVLGLLYNPSVAVHHALGGVVRHCHYLPGGDAPIMRRRDMPHAHRVAGEAGDQFGNALLAHALPLSPQLDAPLDDVADRPVGQPAGTDMLSHALPYD